jgi:hypothetical protein
VLVLRYPREGHALAHQSPRVVNDGEIRTRRFANQMFRVVARCEYALKATGYDQAEGLCPNRIWTISLKITNPAFMECATELRL